MADSAVADTTAEVMSHAERRRQKRPQVIMTAEMKAKRRAELVELRKVQRMMKSNGSRGKLRKYLSQKRSRDSDEPMDSGSDDDARCVTDAMRSKIHRAENPVSTTPSAAVPASAKTPRTREKPPPTTATASIAVRRAIARSVATGKGSKTSASW